MKIKKGFCASIFVSLVILMIQIPPFAYADINIFDEDDAIGNDYYDASYGKSNDGSFVTLVTTSPFGDKAPFTMNAHTGSHALEIQWKMVQGGHWELVISDDGWVKHNAAPYNAICLFANAPATGGPGNSLPQFMLRDIHENFSNPVPMSNFISFIDSDPSTWQKVLIPLSAFTFGPSQYDPNQFSAVRFMDGPPDEITHTLWIDDMVLAKEADLVIFSDTGTKNTYCYDASWGTMEGGSTVDLCPDIGKMPINSRHAYSSSTCGVISWRNVIGGSWSLIVADHRWTSNDISSFNTVEFYVNAPSMGGPGKDLPQLQLEDMYNNKSGCAEMSHYLSSIDDDEVTWQKVSIPLGAFQPFNDFNPAIFKGLVFMNGPTDGISRSMWIDEIGLTTIPSTPRAITILACDQAAIINWSKNNEQRITGYHIYRAEGLEGSYTKLNEQILETNGFSDTAVENGKTYYYKVTAVACSDNESSPSDPISATPMAPKTDDEFLEMISRAAFYYFWYAADPESGLIPERMSQPDTVASGATGFGLTAICVGAERGWISREEARERVLKVLEYLKNTAEDFHGFFSHWMEAKTGTAKKFGDLPGYMSCKDPNKPYVDDKADTWESALLFGGVLACMEYFNADDDTEEEIRKLAEDLYKRAAWNETLAEDGYTLSWHWTPQEGDIPACHGATITGYNEAMMAYILAIGSPTHGIDPICYEKGWARGYNPREGAYGIMLDVGWVAVSLFLHQYSHCWLDLRNKWDGYTDYFKNARNAALINRQYCIENPKEWTEYGENIWGLTSSDGPDGYGAWGPFSNDNGTIAVTGAAGSIPFTPEYSIQVLKYVYKNYRSLVWGHYGFYDAFNLSRKPVWVGKDYIGIDQGPPVLMTENYRSNLVWTLMAQNEWVSSAMDKIFSDDHDASPTVALVEPNADEIQGDVMPVRWECDDSDLDTNGIILQYSSATNQDQLLIDDFEDGNCSKNILGSCNFHWHGENGTITYACQGDDTYRFPYLTNTFCLSISYVCNGTFNSHKGYGTILNGVNASEYDEISFMVKGKTGKEQFRIGLKDTGQNETKLLVHTFLPEGRVTKSWQLASVPLERFRERASRVNLASIENLSFDFDNHSGNGTIFIDEIRFVKWSTISTCDPHDSLYEWDISHLPYYFDHLRIRVIARDKAGNKGFDQSTFYLLRAPQEQIGWLDLIDEKGGCFILILK